MTAQKDQKQVEVKFECPPEMVPFCNSIMNGGEYELIGFDPESPTILDIGANCGAFTLWASHRWPGYASIHAYEPAQINFPLLTKNTEALARVFRTKAAVTSGDKVKLFCGVQNQGQASLHPELGQTSDTYELPPIVKPEALPEANILKVDTEGCELDIIETYLTKHKPKLIMYEYHREEDRRALDTLMCDSGYALVGGQIFCHLRGVQKWFKK